MPPFLLRFGAIPAPRNFQNSFVSSIYKTIIFPRRVLHSFITLRGNSSLRFSFNRDFHLCFGFQTDLAAILVGELIFNSDFPVNDNR